MEMPPAERLSGRHPKNDNNLFWMRHCAALGVLLGHSYALLGQAAPRIFGESVHVVALKVFFIISGYLVCQSWQRDTSIPRYLIKRIVRIFPGLILVVLLMALILGPLLTTYSLHQYFRAPQFRLFLWNIALAPSFELPGVFFGAPSNQAVNGSLWSLPVEFAMYLLVPILAFSGRQIIFRLVNMVLVVGLVAAAFYYQTWGAGQVFPVIYQTSLPFGLQVAGYFAIAAWYRTFALERFLNVQVALAMALLMQLCESSNETIQCLMLLGLPYIVLSLGLAPNAAFAATERFGDASYGLYLYAFPVQQCLIMELGQQTSALLLTVLAVPATLALALVSWHSVEKHALKWKPRYPAGPQGHAGPARLSSAGR